MPLAQSLRVVATGLLAGMLLAMAWRSLLATGVPEHPADVESDRPSPPPPAVEVRTMTHYEVLGLVPGASRQDVFGAFAVRGSEGSVADEEALALGVLTSGYARCGYDAQLGLYGAWRCLMKAWWRISRHGWAGHERQLEKTTAAILDAGRKAGELTTVSNDENELARENRMLQACCRGESIIFGGPLYEHEQWQLRDETDSTVPTKRSKLNDSTHTKSTSAYASGTLSIATVTVALPLPPVTETTTITVTATLTGNATSTTTDVATTDVATPIPTSTGSTFSHANGTTLADEEARAHRSLELEIFNDFLYWVLWPDIRSCFFTGLTLMTPIVLADIYIARGWNEIEVAAASQSFVAFIVMIRDQILLESIRTLRFFVWVAVIVQAISHHAMITSNRGLVILYSLWLFVELGMVTNGY